MLERCKENLACRRALRAFEEFEMFRVSLSPSFRRSPFSRLLTPDDHIGSPLPMVHALCSVPRAHPKCYSRRKALRLCQNPHVFRFRFVVPSSSLPVVQSSSRLVVQSFSLSVPPSSPLPTSPGTTPDGSASGAAKVSA